MNIDTLRHILVTSALPYANGPIHIGHLVEYIQTDIWVRFHKMIGNKIFYICADDAHGSAIMLHAEREQIKPEQLIKKIRLEHIKDFSDFLIEFDHYDSTHSIINFEVSNSIYNKLYKNNLITKKEVIQYYDKEKKMFLADRFIKGICPKCSAKNQFGDNCEICSAIYSPDDLKNPISTISGSTPIKKKSLHYFFKLSNFQKMLNNWINSRVLQETIIKKLYDFLDSGLKDWDISRDKPYFGFKIPNSNNKYFYVWVDALICYISSFKNFCIINPEIDFNMFWNKNSQTELYHFIGKDIINFHALFWPAILEGIGYRKPTKIHVHGYLTVNGQKMSKSRGTFIKARKYLNYLNPEYLRYYYASKLTDSIEDIDFNSFDFFKKVNSDLIGKVINIASRCAGFINKGNNNILVDINHTHNELLNTFYQAEKIIIQAYEKCDFHLAMKHIMILANHANIWIDKKAPWSLWKNINNNYSVQQICTVGINLFRILIIFLKPVLPLLAKKTESFLNITPLIWSDYRTLLTHHKLNSFNKLMNRIELNILDKIFN